MVSVLAFYSDNPSLNFGKVNSFYSVCKEQKEAVDGSF